VPNPQPLCHLSFPSSEPVGAVAHAPIVP